MNKIDIKFNTSVETGGPYFTIEKSKDGKEFTKLVDIPSIESGTTYSDYFETDYQPYSGVSYYRIKQTDEAGNYRYSQMVTLKVEEEQAPSNITTLSKKNETLLLLRDANGNDYYSKVKVDSKNNSLKAQNMSPTVSEGTYHIIGSSNDEVYNHKVIVK